MRDDNRDAMHEQLPPIPQHDGRDETDAFLADVQNVITAGHRACASIERALAALERGAEATHDHASFPRVIESLIGSGGRAVRLQSAEAFEDFERAVGVMRARVITTLVDVYGMSLTEAGRYLEVSRQAAARLYARGTDDDQRAPSS